ncbi:hypothetical protein IGK74_002331 [Enterococcus sp. AZ150]|uniref:hypothetical protein n=1 Tax=Enterococcus sp. AZ150 TaxID=2774866 RepID=UPI003F2546A1
MSEELKGRLNIRGLSSENLEILNLLKTEYGFQSINQMFIFFVDTICDKKKLDILDSKYSNQQKKINANIEILSNNLEKLVDILRADQIENLKLYKETLHIKKGLENLNTILLEEEI